MGSGLGKRKVISGVVQKISIRTNFVHFINHWAGKKKRPCSQGDSTRCGLCVAGEWQAMKNKRSCNQIQTDLYEMYRAISSYRGSKAGGKDAQKGWQQDAVSLGSEGLGKYLK